MKEGDIKIKRRNKRGLSGIVITLIIIGLSLVAIGVIWGVVSNIIKSGSGQIQTGSLTVDLTITNAHEQEGVVSVNVRRRNSGQGEITSIKFVLSDGGDTEVITREVTSFEELASQSFALNPIKLIPATILTVSVAPVLKTSDGKEIVGEITSTYTLSRGGSVGGTGTCGDGVVNTGEMCDGSIPLGLTCSDFGFSSGSLSCLSCQISSSGCSGGSVGGTGTCGDGVVNTGEMCDGYVPSGLTCSDFGFASGILSCSNCQIVTSDCTNEVGCTTNCGSKVCGPSPNGCNGEDACGVCATGTCSEDGLSCVGCTPIPSCPAENICGSISNGCGGELTCGTCPAGQLCNPSGTSCDEVVFLNSGIIEDVWPGTSGLYFGSSSLPTDITYKNKWVKFPGSEETGCRQIIVYWFPLGGYTKSHVGFNFRTLIAVGDNYKIFATSQECEAA